MPQFSIVIPLYNKAPYVRKAVESVVSQTFADWELIVVDDGSGDGSGAVVQSISDPRIRVLRQENQGVSMARNNGVMEAQAPYICFLDADDWWDSRFLERMADAIHRYPDARLFGANYWIMRNGRQRLAPIALPEGFQEGVIDYFRTYAATLCMPVTSSSACLSRQLFLSLGGFDPKIQLGEDFLLWVSIALRHPVVFLNTPLAYYNQDVDNGSRLTKRKAYNPDTFMTFHLDRFAEDESNNADLKILFDRLRVTTLMNFRRHNLFPERVRREIAKVDFSHVPRIYRFYYKAPAPIVSGYCAAASFLSFVKKKLSQ